MSARVCVEAGGHLQVDGRPFFLVGARHMPVGGTPELLREAGFNAYRVTVFGNEGQDPEPLPPPLEGLRFWAYLYNRADFTAHPKHREQLRASVEQLRRHPSLLCYENYNEPTLLYKSDRFKCDPRDLAAGTAELRLQDPDHPLWLAHACTNTVETLRRFNACADILGCNPYPLYVPGMRRHIGVRADGRMLDCPDQSIHAVARYTDKILRVGRRRMPVWMLIQAMANEHWYSPHHTPQFAGQGIQADKVLYPTYEEMRFMAWDTIIAGASGLALAMFGTPVTSPVWADIKRLVRELRGLETPLCAGTPAGRRPRIRYTDLGYTIWDGVRMVCRQAGNQLHLFAANTAVDPAEVTISLPWDVGSAATVLGEEREVPLAGARLHDRFEPYAVHLYSMELSP